MPIFTDEHGKNMNEIQLASWHEHMKVFEEYSRIYGSSHPKTLRIKKSLNSINPNIKSNE